VRKCIRLLASEIPKLRAVPSIIGGVTEIPEHLLKRSRERRAAIGQGDEAGGEAGGEAAPATTPATTSATTTPAAAKAATPAPAASSSAPAARTAAPAPAAAPPVRPDPPYVAAAKRRKKIPIWAMATLGLMPVWGFIYVRALTAPPTVVAGPVGAGAEVYSACAGCHGADGGGGVGYQFSGGEVLKTFPHIEDQLRWVYYGTEGYNAANIKVYGNANRPGGAHETGAKGVMPAFGGQLSGDQIVAVVCHERYTLAGADPTSKEYADEYNAWCAADSPLYTGLKSGAFNLNDDTLPPVTGPNGEIKVGVVGSKPAAPAG
jgi:mono/diheme cytochrome c family protein